jgi:hypothetical protein
MLGRELAKERLVRMGHCFPHRAFRGEARAEDSRLAGAWSRTAGRLEPPLGHMMNSNGGTDEKTIWGKQADWVDYWGTVNGEAVGIAVFDNPQNLRHPTYWHARHYGLLAANPFGVREFTHDRHPDGSYTIPAGGVLVLRYRVFVHHGDYRQARVTEAYSRYAEARIPKRKAGAMSSQSEVSRRDFLKASAKATSGIAALQGITFLARPGRVFGANDRVRVAVCGLHGRGKDHLAGFARVPNVEIAALCDVDENVLNKARGEVSGNAQTFVDVRKLLEDKSIDAISIATPNHWHALIAIWACQAGKDVYVEKPCSHNLWEGRQLVHAAQTYNRIVQHGTQIRSAPAIQEAVKGLHGGRSAKCI